MYANPWVTEHRKVEHSTNSHALIPTDIAESRTRGVAMLDSRLLLQC